MEETYRELTLNFKQTRSEKVFTKLYAKIKPGITNYIFSITKDKDVTDDIVADTLGKLYTHIDQYDPSYEVTTWMYRIAKNSAIQWIYRRNKLLSLNHFSENGTEAVEGDDRTRMGITQIESGVTYAKTEEEFLEEDRILIKKYNMVLEAIQTMKPKYRQIMKDRFISKMNYNSIELKNNEPLFEKIAELKAELASLAETSEEYSRIESKIEEVKKKLINLQTVKNRINRGRKMLQSIFENHPNFRKR